MDKDVIIIRELAKKIEEISHLQNHQIKISNWEKLNQLKADKPMLYVWEDELPWKEMNVSNELDLKTVNTFYREQEQILRKKLYMWNYLMMK